MKTKKRHILTNEWTELRSDIERARKDLSIRAEEFRELKIGEWENIQKNIYDAFLFQRRQETTRSWLWNDFKVEDYAIGCKSDPYEKLNLLLDEDELVYFFVNETVNEQTKYWYYEGKINSIISVIGETIGLDEYYLSSKKYDWLLSTNHHDVLTGVGTIISKMKEKEEEIKAENKV